MHESHQRSLHASQLERPFASYNFNGQMIAASAPSAQATASSSTATAIPAAGGGSQQHYEVLLFGEFVNENGRLDAIMNRLSLVCEGGSDTVQFAEWHFHPAHRPPEEASGPSASSLTLRRVVGSPGWYVSSALASLANSSSAQDSPLASETRACTRPFSCNSSCSYILHNRRSRSGVRERARLRVSQQTPFTPHS